MKRFNGRAAEILLVEDNPGDVILTTIAFETAKVNNQLHVVNDGEQAIDFLRQQGEYRDEVLPDLILLDLNLPKKNGIEVLNELKQDEDLRRIPVVILTSSTAERDVVQSYNVYASGYVVKPLDGEQFNNIVMAIESFWLSIVVLPDDPTAARSATAM